MSSTPPGGRAGDSPRVAEARSRATLRALRQGTRLHLALWAIMVSTALSAAQSQPGPGVTGERLVVSLALAACLLSLAFAALIRRRQPEAVTVALSLVLGGGGSVLAFLQSGSLMVVPVSAAVALLFARLRPGLAVLPAVPLTAAITVVTACVSTSGNAFQEGTAAALLCAVLGAVCMFARQARLRHDQAELLLAELEDSREAQARAAAVAERTRIARELHDVLAQSLSALAVQLEGARKLAERDEVDPVLRQLIVRSGELTREGLSDARQAVAALRGDDAPVADQLTALVGRCRRDLALPITLSVSGQPRTLTPEANLALYRGAQEALTNAARYAPGSPTTVVLRYTPQATTLTVSDEGRAAGARDDDTGDGVPAPPAEAWTGGGNGLRGMRERIERVGGRSHAGPAGEGWTVEMEIPV
ncbi:MULTISPECIES: sensor histidine kinase [Streptomyces]|uniref:sensor histidine kinase n=1 Tax=Streptomyces TaxID=1883 RepID=UPI00163B83DE|nr:MULTISPECIES: histidine kinase [Streptomyces]MBC2875843.1 two-component sensor histidine kinase [Streptomyces sp. TYQ1024]UBI37693.1 histidine kinase [Streptomyces mobaraensis]UKW30280.1 histidine kinase [Streptomyces sp. TYQ1024]